MSNSLHLKRAIQKVFPRENNGLLLYLFSAHFIMLSNILYLVVLHKSVLPIALQGPVTSPLIRAAHSFAYAIFLAFCSQGTNPQNSFSRTKKGIQIGVAGAFVLVILSTISSSISSIGVIGEYILPLLFFCALIFGAYGDAMATPALLGIIASTGEKKGPKYVGYFWISISFSYIYAPLLANHFLSLIKQDQFFRIFPFAFDLLLSLSALVIFPVAFSRLEKAKPPIQPPKARTSNKKAVASTVFTDLFKILISENPLRICVLILAANQFAFNSLKTASQELSRPWNHLGLTGNAIMFFITSLLVAMWWKKSKNTEEKTRTIVLTSLWMILAVGFLVIVLNKSPTTGAGIMLLFGPFSAILYTGINIYYTQFLILKGESKLGARLGMFSSLYRFFGSIGYLVTALISMVHVHIASQLPEPILAFLINSLPVMLVILYFTRATKKTIGGNNV